MNKSNNVSIIGVNFSMHALQRMAQRGLSEEDVDYICQYGRIMHRAGARFLVLGKNDIPRVDASKMSRLSGAVVALDRFEDDVLTVYRNENALKHIRKKSKWDKASQIPGRQRH